MNRTPDVELVLREYLADDGLAAPDHILEVTEQRILRQPQRRMWRLRGRPFMNPYAKLVAVAAAILIVIAVAGWNLLPGNTGPGAGPSPTPTLATTLAPTLTAAPTLTPGTAPSATPTACEEDGKTGRVLEGCAGPLAAGTFQSVHFAPAFEYTVPADWANPIDIDGIFALTTSGADAEVYVWSSVVPAEATGDCTIVAKAGAGTGVDDWMTFLTTHPGLIASNVRSIAMNGSTAQAVDLRVNSDWVPPCPTELGLERVPLIKAIPSSPGDGLGLNGGVQVRLYAVGVGNQTVIVTVYSWASAPEALAKSAATLEPVVSSFRWACNAESPPGPCWGPPDASGNPATPPPS